MNKDDYNPLIDDEEWDSVDSFNDGDSYEDDEDYIEAKSLSSYLEDDEDDDLLDSLVANNNNFDDDTVVAIKDTTVNTGSGKSGVSANGTGNVPGSVKSVVEPSTVSSDKVNTGSGAVSGEVSGGNSGTGSSKGSGVTGGGSTGVSNIGSSRGSGSNGVGVSSSKNVSGAVKGASKVSGSGAGSLVKSVGGDVAGTAGKGVVSSEDSIGINGAGGNAGFTGIGSSKGSGSIGAGVSGGDSFSVPGAGGSLFGGKKKFVNPFANVSGDDVSSSVTGGVGVTEPVVDVGVGVVPSGFVDDVDSVGVSIIEDSVAEVSESFDGGASVVDDGVDDAVVAGLDVVSVDDVDSGSSSVVGGVVNSVDDGGEFVIDVVGLAGGLGKRVDALVVDDGDVEAFLGVPGVSYGGVVEVPAVVDSGVVNPFLVEDVNPLLEEDEEDFIVPVVVGDSGAGVFGNDSLSGSGVVSSVGGSVDGSIGGGVGDAGLLGEVERVASEREHLIGVEDRERLVGFRERVSGLRERVNAGRVVDERVGPRHIESDFKRVGVREVVVDPGVEVSSGGGVGSRVRGPGGRLGAGDLSLFKNLGSSKGAVLGDDLLVGGLRDAVGSGSRAGVVVDQALRGTDGLRRGARGVFGVKDRDVLRFLAMFRYATDAQLSRMFSQSVKTSYNRLKKLRNMGLVVSKRLYGARPIWYVTEAGMLLAGVDVPRVRESTLSFSMFPHQFTVNNTAANLWGANVNVLNLSDFPSRNRVGVKGDLVFGEELVSELEIQSSFGKIKMFDKAEVFRPELMGNIDRLFAKWESSGGAAFGDSPEMLLGNEYMWALMPPFNVRLAYHVPDLVVKRPRAADGSPRSIAVEIEINNKPGGAYEKTLKAYRADKRLYEKVIWVCKNVGPARKLEQIAKEIGLWQEGRIEIVPVITESGVFKERDLWEI